MNAVICFENFGLPKPADSDKVRAMLPPKKILQVVTLIVMYSSKKSSTIFFVLGQLKNMCEKSSLGTGNGPLIAQNVHPGFVSRLNFDTLRLVPSILL